MSVFDDAFAYVLANEGGWSNDKADTGGATRYGITDAVARAHGYSAATLTLDQAKAVYRADYWRFDLVTLPRVAIKMFDMCVNVGMREGIELAQRAAGALVDGVLGLRTLAAINATEEESMIERLSMALADFYVSLVIAKTSQIVFLKGWIRRAIRRPRTIVAAKEATSQTTT